MQDHSRYFDRPTVVHRWLTELTGSFTAGAMLSQALYWSYRTSEPDGWFYKTQRDWQIELGLSRTEQEGARKKLRNLGFWHECRRGVPAKLFFRVDRAAMMVALDALPGPWWCQESQQNSHSPQYAENQHTRMLDSHILECGKPAIKISQNPHSINKECARVLDLKTETTTESVRTRARATHTLPPLAVVQNGQDKKPESPPTTTPAPRRMLIPLPDAWAPSLAVRTWAQEQMPTIPLPEEADKFRDHARATGKVLKDWDAAFRNWLRQAVTYAQRQPQRQGKAPPRSKEEIYKNKCRTMIALARANNEPINPKWEEALRDEHG